MGLISSVASNLRIYPSEHFRRFQSRFRRCVLASKHSFVFIIFKRGGWHHFIIELWWQEEPCLPANLPFHELYQHLGGIQRTEGVQSSSSRPVTVEQAHSHDQEVQVGLRRRLPSVHGLSKGSQPSYLDEAIRRATNISLVPAKASRLGGLSHVTQSSLSSLSRTLLMALVPYAILKYNRNNKPSPFAEYSEG
jgi:hypothetical protein